MSTAAERFTPRQRELLARFVSNLDENVYAIYNLPEEVVAVIFAYVSRSPRSFRENLLRLMEDPELNLLGSLPSQPEPAAAGGRPPPPRRPTQRALTRPASIGRARWRWLRERRARRA